MSKIVRTESRASSLLERFAEVMPILCKDSANQSRASSLLERYAEVMPILCKDSANREQSVKLA